MPLWLLFTLGAALSWSIGQLFAKKGFSNISPLWNNIIANSFLLVIDIPGALLLSHFHLHVPSLKVIFFLFLAGITYMLFFYAISKGELALTGTLWATYPITTVILAILFLGEKLNMVQIVGIVLAILGSLAIALPEKKLPSLVTKDKSWIIWGLGGAIVVGAGDFFIKAVTNEIGTYSQIFFLAIIAQFLSVGNYIVDPKGRKLPAFSFKKFMPTFIGTFFSVCGNFLFYIAFGYGIASIVGPVSSVYPAFTVVLAVIFLQEKISKKQLAGIISIVLGIILISIKI